MNRPPPLLISIARAIAVLFAIFVVAWLVVNAHRDANPVRQEPAPDEPAVDPLASTPSIQIDGDGNEPFLPAPEPMPFLFSSKSAVIDERMLPGAPDSPFAPAPAQPTFLHTSKSLRLDRRAILDPAAKPAAPPHPARAILDPAATAGAPAPAPQDPRFLPSSKTITPVVTPKPPVLVFPAPKPQGTERAQR